jgi:hypothetical protein
MSPIVKVSKALCARLGPGPVTVPCIPCVGENRCMLFKGRSKGKEDIKTSEVHLLANASMEGKKREVQESE